MSAFTRIALASMLATCAACGAAATRPFPLAEPIWRDRDQRPFAEKPEELYTAWIWDQVDNVAFRQLSELWAIRKGREALNVNSLDEVPDSSWFENRLGRRTLTRDQVALGACEGVDEPPKPWTIVRGKTGGTTPGVNIEAADGHTYVFKVDFWQPERNTAADSISTRLLHALGYSTPCNMVVLFEPGDFEIAPDAHTSGHDPRPYTEDDLHELLASAGVAPDGRLRGTLSRFIDGPPLGGFQFLGTRGDDPNDVFPHEHRRELRGMYVLSAWMNHIDTRAENNYDAWIETEGGDGYVRHYVLDAGDSFGIAWPESADMSMRFGHAHYIDLQFMTEDFLTLGLFPRPYRDVTKGPAFEVFGYYDVGRFVPDRWRNGYPNAAFEQHTERDAAWMARLIARLDVPSLRAIVETGRFSRDLYSHELVRILRGRQRKVLERYLTRLSPLAAPAIEERDGRQELCLDDLAVVSGIRSASSRHARATSFSGWPPGPGEPVDARVGPDGRVCVALAPPQVGHHDPPRYLIVDVAVSTAGRDTPGPARVHLYQVGPELFRIVGLERPEDDEPPHA